MTAFSSRRGFLRVIGGALVGAAVVGAAAKSESTALNQASPLEPAPAPVNNLTPNVITFEPGETTSGTIIPRAVGEAGRLHPGAARHQLEVVWSVDTSQKLIAMTFDDGPVPGVSEVLYGILDEAKVRATFFLVGERVLTFANLLHGRMDRHEVGNHTWSHQSTFTKTDAEVLEDISQAHRAIHDVLGREPKLFRPPYSHVNGATLVAAGAMGYDLCMWEGDLPYIGFNESNQDGIVTQVLGQAAPGQIFLGHDGAPEYLIMIRQLPKIFSELKRQGYEFVTIPELRAAQGK